MLVRGQHEVRLRKVQTGPELGMASLAQHIAEEEVSSAVNAADAQETTKGANASMKGEIEDGNFDVLISARCKMGFDRHAMWHNGLPSPSYFTNTVCWLPALSAGRADEATTARKLLRAAVDLTRPLSAPR